jgi:integrase
MGWLDKNNTVRLRKLFNWAIGTGEFGIDASPLERLQPVELIGRRETRERTLSDAELRAVWDVAGQMGYPYGPVFRLLILTAQRENEVAGMRWSEVDLKQRLWTIPSPRMKGDRAHEIPLAPRAFDLIEALPRRFGDCVFSTTGSQKPINGLEDLVREAVIAHAQKGLHRVYDRHSYQSEKRQCLELWEQHLLAIVEPLPADIPSIAEERVKRAGAA